MGVTALNIARRWYRGHDFPWIVEREKGKHALWTTRNASWTGMEWQNALIV